MNLSFILCFNWATFWSFVTAIATLLIAFIAWRELSKSRNVTTAKFIQDFDSRFFTPETRELITLFEFEEIEFVKENKGEGKLENLPEDFSYFKVTMKDYRRKGDIPSSLADRTDIYTCYEIDDFLIGLIEDLGLFEQKGIVSFNFVNEVFGYYIRLLGDNVQIKNYISCIREEYKDSEIYNKFEYLIRRVNGLPKNAIVFDT